VLAKRRVQVFLEDADWDYLGQMADIIGTSRSSIMRDMIEQFTGMMRRAMGQDLKGDKLDVVQFMRVMMIETGKAMTEVGELPDKVLEKSKQKPNA